MSGDAWAVNKQPCAAGFDTRFQFQISNMGAGRSDSRSDGIVFAVQNVGPNPALAFRRLAGRDQQCQRLLQHVLELARMHRWPDL